MVNVHLEWVSRKHHHVHQRVLVVQSSQLHTPTQRREQAHKTRIKERTSTERTGVWKCVGPHDATWANMRCINSAVPMMVPEFKNRYGDLVGTGCWLHVELSSKPASAPGR